MLKLKKKKHKIQGECLFKYILLLFMKNTLLLYYFQVLFYF